MRLSQDRLVSLVRVFVMRRSCYCAIALGVLMRILLLVYKAVVG